MAADPSEIAQAVAEAFEELNKKLGDANLRWGGLDKAIQSLQIRMNATAKDYRDDNEAYKRIMRERKTREQEILKAQRDGVLTYRETQKELNLLNKSIESVIPAEYKTEFKNFIDNQGRANILQMTTNRILLNFNKEIQVSAAVLNGLSNASSKIFGAYQSGENDIKMAGTTTAAAAGLFFNATSGVGKGLTALGESAMGAAPFMGEFGLAAGAAGLALTALGKVVDYGSQKLNDLAQKAIPILTAEVDKLYNSFNSISSSGAVFANGLVGMNNAALAVRLTLPEFSDVLKQSSGDLAGLGVNVTEAAKRMGEVGTVMRKNGIALELQKLGFTYKEQASLIADTMAIMRQSGGRLTADDQEVAEQTRKYAENLRIISDITGEDAKKKEQQVRDQSNELAFQQKLAGMDEKQRQNVIAAMENMSDAQRKAFMETVVFGQAITPASAYAVSNIAGFGDSVARAAQEFQNGTLDAETMRKNNADYGNIIKDSLIGATDLARAGMVGGVSGFVKDLKDLYQGELQFRNVFTKDAIDAAEEAVKRQTTATNDLDDGMLRAANAGRDMATQIQKAVLDSHVLNTFADTIADVTESIVKTIREFTGSAPQTAEERRVSRNEENASILAKATTATVDTLLMPVTGLIKLLYNQNQSLTPLYDQYVRNNGQPIQMQRSAPLLQNPTDVYGSGMGMFADGGISSGPKSGYFAQLHGTEAVLPENLTSMLVDLANKPSQVDDFTKAVNNAALQNKSEDLLAMLNDKFDTMIDIMDDISGHTEKTAVRVA